MPVTPMFGKDVQWPVSQSGQKSKLWASVTDSILKEQDREGQKKAVGILLWPPQADKCVHLFIYKHCIHIYNTHPDPNRS